MSRSFLSAGRLTARALVGLSLCAGVVAGAPAPLMAADSSENGEQLFATTCGWCHSQGGREAGKGPKLAGTQRSDEFIINRIKNGKPGQMPGFAATLNDQQIHTILAYIRSLPSD
ncbi:MAG: cytochrome c [Acetobacteraceae bacterium]|nr:cytochrome c [Acetobacteraceae bacterium]